MTNSNEPEKMPAEELKTSSKLTFVDHQRTLSLLFEDRFDVKPESFEMLPRSGSDRIYFRLKADERVCIGAYNADIKENEAFFSFTRSFLQCGINVPDLLAIDVERCHYLLTDLGRESLYDRISAHGDKNPCDAAICLLKEVLSGLLKIQIEGAKLVDFGKCYPRSDFDRQSLMWDLNYFKYDFLKFANVPFDEQKLEDDFNRLADLLMQVPSGYFMYRDFQSRNIMLVGNTPWFIDYQGGRRGPLHYDLASILFSPKTGLNQVQREVLLDYYLNLLEGYGPVDRDEFTASFYMFALIRILQALGAYGFRGIFEQKPNFRDSIPQAIQNLNILLDKGSIKTGLPELFRIIRLLSSSEWARPYQLGEEKLTIRVSSFSFKKGLPYDPSGNGGGFVFDCRGLPNPGRFPEYQFLSGLDHEVGAYLERFAEVEQFHEAAKKMVEISVNDYLKRNFNHLCISFGCTGGQHRSVFQAEKMAQWLKNNFGANVVVLHTERENWKTNV